MPLGGVVVIYLCYTIALTLLTISSLNYMTPLWQVIAIATLIYLAERIVFKSKISALWFIGTALFSVLFYGYLMHRLERLEEQLSTLYDFLKLYLLSATEPNVSIAGTHEILAIAFIAALYALLLHGLFIVKRAPFNALAISTLGFIGIGFAGDLMHTNYAKVGFVVLIICLIVDYFMRFYQHYIIKKYQSFKLSPKLMYTTIGCVIIAVLLSSSLLYRAFPEPFVIKEERHATAQSGSGEGAENINQQRTEQFKNLSSQIQATFEHHSIPIFKVKSQENRYIKIDVYENYINGVWLKNSEHNAPSDLRIDQSGQIDAVDFKQYYHIETIDIILSNVTTDQIFTSPYGNYSVTFPSVEGTSIIYDNTRHVYFASQPLPTDYSYSLQAILPHYGNAPLMALIEQNADRPVPAAIGLYALQVPDEQAMYYEHLAKTLTAKIDGKYNKALAIEQYLKNNYHYTERPKNVPDGEDPIVYFINDSQEGFCQHFNSALIMLLRSIDIPARYVKGYYYEPVDQDAAERQGYLEGIDSGDEYQTIYDFHAHAWVEAYFPEVGWITLDATPGRNYFSSGRQQPELPEVEPIPPEESEQETPQVNPASVKRVPIYLIIGLVALIAIGYLVWRLLRYKKALKERPINDQIIARYKIVRDYYGLRALKKASTETHREFAQRIDRSVQPIYKLTLARLIEPYEAIIYGDIDATSEDLTHYDAYLKSLKFYLRYSTNRLRYLRVQLVEFFSV